MADNVELAAASGGAVVATDDAGAGGHVQIVKLALSADGSAVPITADANGLLVKLSAQGGVDLMDVTVNNGTGASAVPIQDGGNSITVDGTVAVTGVATEAKQDTLIGHVDGLEGLLTTIDADTGNISTKIDTLAGAVAGTEVQVDVLTMPNVTLAAGTNTNEVVGDAAHDAAIAGNPVRIGGRALSANYTAVTAGDTADLITDLIGRLVTLPYALPGNSTSGATSDMTATTSTEVLAAPGAGLRNYVTHLVIQNSHASVGTWVNVTDGSGGSVLYTVYCVSGGGGASITFPTPLRQTTTATALHVVNVTTGANTRASASGYIAP